jgi:WD40 repeat protein
MTTSLPRTMAARHFAIRMLLACFGIAVLQSGCLADLDVGTSPMRTTDSTTSTSTGTPTGTGAPTGTSVAPTSTQTDLSVDTTCEHLSLKPNVLNPCGRITGLAYSPDGQYLASSSLDSSANVVVWRMSDGARVARYGAIDWAGSLAIAFSGDGRYLASASYAAPGDPGVLELWEVGTGQLVYGIDVSLGMHADTIAWSLDSSLLAIGGEAPGVEIWNVQTHQLVHRLAIDSATHNIHFAPDNSRMLTISADGNVRMWNVGAWTEPTFTVTVGPQVTDAAFSPDQLQIVTVNSDRPDVRLWNGWTGEWMQATPVFPGTVEHVIWVDRDTIITNDSSGLVTSWSMQGDGWLKNPTGWTWMTAGTASGGAPDAGQFERSRALAISPSGKTLAAGGMDPATNRYGFMFLAR